MSCGMVYTLSFIQVISHLWFFQSCVSARVFSDASLENISPIYIVYFCVCPPLCILLCVIKTPLVAHEWPHTGMSHLYGLASDCLARLVLRTKDSSHTVHCICMAFHQCVSDCVLQGDCFEQTISRIYCICMVFHPCVSFCALWGHCFEQMISHIYIFMA